MPELFNADWPDFIREKLEAIKPSMEPLYIKESGPLPPAKPGDVLYTGGVDHPVDLDRKFRFEMSFAEAGAVENRLIVPTLQEMIDLVNSVVTGFAGEGHFS